MTSPAAPNGAFHFLSDNMTTGLFTDDADFNMTVRVFNGGEASKSGMSIDLGKGDGPNMVMFPEDTPVSALVEALQFAADTLGASLPSRLTPFERGWQDLAQQSYDNAVAKGFWDVGLENRNDSEMIMLMVTELAEAVEGLRHGNPPDDKIPEFSSVEAEFADVLIRMMDHAHARGWRVAKAVKAKMAKNQTRARMHGKAF